MGKNGGYRPGAGRKPKADELKLIEKLSPLDDVAFEKIKDGIDNGDFQYVKLFMDYRFGKPKERMDVTSDGEKINNAIQVEIIRTNVKAKNTI